MRTIHEIKALVKVVAVCEDDQAAMTMAHKMQCEGKYCFVRKCSNGKALVLTKNP